MAKVLLLATYDTKLSGHAYTKAQQFKQDGHEVCFISLYKTEDAPVSCIFGERRGIGKFLYFWLNYFLLRFILAPKDNIHCFCSTYLVGISAKKILSKCPFRPDYIFISWVPGFLKAKTVSDLYKLTNAKIVISMIDEAILSLCHYHCDCEQFKSGCKDCPAVRCKWIPRYVMSQRKKYWTDIPMIIYCANNDSSLGKQVEYLSNKDFYPYIPVPTIPFVTSKQNARERLGLSESHFIIFAGAHYLYEKRKGFDVLVESINLFATKTNLEAKKVTLLLVGYGSGDYAKKISGVNVVAKDFIKGSDFYNAYYACDVYASPTLADSGPMMVNFAIACGRPVIAFPIGYALDLVVSKKTGYMAKYGSAEDFANGFELFYSMNDDELQEYDYACKSWLLSCADISKHFVRPL